VVTVVVVQAASAAAPAATSIVRIQACLTLKIRLPG
jgi:hypothetical protein